MVIQSSVMLISSFWLKQEATANPLPLPVAVPDHAPKSLAPHFLPGPCKALWHGFDMLWGIRDHIPDPIEDAILLAIGLWVLGPHVGFGLVVNGPLKWILDGLKDMARIISVLTGLNAAQAMAHTGLVDMTLDGGEDLTKLFTTGACWFIFEPFEAIDGGRQETRKTISRTKHALEWT